MTPEQSQTLTVGMSVTIPLPVFSGYGERVQKVGEGTALAKVGARYHCKEIPPTASADGWMRFTELDVPAVDKYGYFWAEYADNIRQQPRRLLVHISESEVVGAAG